MKPIEVRQEALIAFQFCLLQLLPSRGPRQITLSWALTFDPIHWIPPMREDGPRRRLVPDGWMWDDDLLQDDRDWLQIKGRLMDYRRLLVKIRK